MLAPGMHDVSEQSGTWLYSFCAESSSLGDLQDEHLTERTNRGQA